MEDQTWDYLFPPLKHSRSSVQSGSDLCIDMEEINGDDDFRTEFGCPYCAVELDIIELCCHIEDDHVHEADSGICPICDRDVSSNMVDHITTQHENVFKFQQKLDFLKGDSHANIALLKKELEDVHLSSFLESSSSAASSDNLTPDPLISSFIYNLHSFNKPESVRSSSSAGESTAEKILQKNTLERTTHPPPLSDKEQEEKARRSEFVQGLLWSTIFDENS